MPELQDEIATLRNYVSNLSGPMRQIYAAQLAQLEAQAGATPQQTTPTPKIDPTQGGGLPSAVQNLANAAGGQTGGATTAAPSAFGALYGPLTAELAGLVAGQALNPEDYASVANQLYAQQLPFERLEEQRIGQDVEQAGVLAGRSPGSGATEQLRALTLEPLRSAFTSRISQEALAQQNAALNRLLSATGLEAGLDVNARQAQLQGLQTAGGLLSGLYTPSVISPQIMPNVYGASPGQQILGAAGSILGGKRQQKNDPMPYYGTPPIVATGANIGGLAGSLGGGGLSGGWDFGNWGGFG